MEQSGSGRLWTLFARVFVPFRACATAQLAPVVQIDAAA